jgi:hypothetical protein
VKIPATLGVREVLFAGLGSPAPRQARMPAATTPHFLNIFRAACLKNTKSVIDLWRRIAFAIELHVAVDDKRHD